MLFRSPGSSGSPRLSIRSGRGRPTLTFTTSVRAVARARARKSPARSPSVAFELRVPGGSLVALTQQPVVHVPRAPPPAKPDENDENRRDCSSDHDGLAEGDALVQCEGVLDRGVDERELALEPAARVCDASDDSKEEDSDEPVCERRVRQPSRDLGMDRAHQQCGVGASSRWRAPASTQRRSTC